jgi:uncharacterized protein (DUF1501 family)
MTDQIPLSSRRDFLRQTACAALTTTGILSTVWDLRMVNAAVPAVNDYKALVCIFLYGGNDGNNLLVPRSGADYAGYAGARNVLALPQSSLLPITPAVSDGRDYGLHPSCAQLQSLFSQGKLAILSNVGTLLAPLTRAQFLAGSAAVPSQLFSHNDQAIQWQTSIPDAEPRTGWGGRCADLLASVNEGSQISMSVSLGGVNLFEVGESVQQYHVSTSGSVGLTGLSAGQIQTMRDLIGQEHVNLFEHSQAQLMNRAIENDALLTAALAGAPAVNTAFPGTQLGEQLRMVARLISARNGLSMKRQIFFCAVGGYDTHGDQLNGHAQLLQELSGAMSAFHNSTVEMGISSQVTTFTASDFGRTLPCNGLGSDHGWGGHQLILGGAVRGGRLYGTYPTLVVDGPNDTGLGRWIPTTSVDEYSATLARWFGVPASDMTTVFPNLGRFAQPDLGFML